jgi:hypothetical protein
MNSPGFGILGIGHSHLTAMQIALDATPEFSENFAIHSQFVQLLEPGLAPSFHEASGGPVMNLALREKLAAAIAALPRPTTAAIFLSGNEYHFIGMFNQERSFDFVLPEVPDLPLIDGAEIIPEHLLAARFIRQIHVSVVVARLLRAELAQAGIPCYALATPPPVPDNDFLMNPASHFYPEMTRFGVAPPCLRYKLWRLQSRIFVEELTAAGLVCLPAPADTIDQDGFMRPPGWHPDGVHGNAWYGEALLRQILDLNLVETPVA